MFQDTAFDLEEVITNRPIHHELPPQPVPVVIGFNPVQLPPQQKPVNPVILPKPTSQVSPQNIVDGWVASILTPLVANIMGLINQASNPNLLTQANNIGLVNKVLKELATLKVYFDIQAKKETSTINKNIQIYKVKAIDGLIKNISTAYEKMVKSLGGSVRTNATTFLASDTKNVSGISLNWSGGIVKATYTTFSPVVTTGKPPVTTVNPAIPVNDLDSGTTPEKPNNGTNILWWILGGYGAYRIYKMIG
ncbi:hypothetical protein [Aquimarina spongiae]|uniref:Uncharacterized protein n=1 Tax=Aquimarina spongiae TaxID=570521 RepID=A0A1M6JEY2_9FLAO|nr:hypothetical protein [Aquimarina spongiae]SHJ45230.1 hypothetical protein SAMN04488508_10931 [Aquimarina spongiae]